MKALIISRGAYPNGDAQSVRHQQFAKLLINTGYHVKVIGINTNNTMNSVVNNEFDGVPFLLYSIKKPKSFIHKIYAIIYYDLNIVRYLRNEIIHPNLILVTGTLPFLFVYIKYFSKKYNISLYENCEEYYSFDQVSNDYRYILNYIATKIRYQLLIKNPLSVISISNYLNSFFTDKKIRSFHLPVIMDKESFTVKDTKSEKYLRITYAGSPGRKDYLNKIIHALLNLSDDERNHIDFTLMGVNNNELADICGISEIEILRLKCVSALGRVSREEVLLRLQITDFTILIRSSTARYAKAGFPTKVVESLMSSTPVICNMTSDLGMYLKDGYDCIEVEHEDPDSIVKALRRALALTPEQKDQMKKNARKTAEENFDYRLYIEEFGKFIKNES